MARRQTVVTAFSMTLIALSLTGCGGGGSDDSAPPPVQQVTVNAPQNVQAVAQDGEISISWGGDSTAEAYDIYLASDLELDYENYSTYDNAVRLMDATSPTVYTPSDISPLYRVVVVAKRASQESAHEQLITVAPRYTDQGETVLDHQTNLVWKKCAIGQVYDEAQNTCVNDPALLSHRETQTYINDYEQEFRLPTQAELITLVHCDSGKPAFFLTDTEMQCEDTTQDASLYTTLFSGTIFTQISGYRSSTIYDRSQGVDVYTRVEFGRLGGRSNIQGSEPAPTPVRLVKK
ncbi:DUF1566 domain-containing protein [uncultured Alteromonas sp.]|jgi:hypothetical protein|uniref:Lcl domain-containing protein n=1 Tax=uncultured Alteromonas sp. TaxID=179113 RepID=UPI0030CB9AA7|tara:strand:- start:2518 stop:3390 length:873 start_codon:yes stop_codon:yes gene_type:complete